MRDICISSGCSDPHSIAIIELECRLDGNPNVAARVQPRYLQHHFPKQLCESSCEQYLLAQDKWNLTEKNKRISVAEGNVINPALTLVCPQDKYLGQILSTALVISAKKGLWKGERCPKSSWLRWWRTTAQAFCIARPELPICLSEQARAQNQVQCC